MSVDHKVFLELRTNLDLNEAETRALNALSIYGTKSFLEVFYKEMGKSYLEPHEKGIRTLFAKIKASAGPAISTVDKARKVLEDGGM